MNTMARDMSSRFPKLMEVPTVNMPWVWIDCGILRCEWNMSDLPSEDVAFAFQTMSPLAPRLEFREVAKTPT